MGVIKTICPECGEEFNVFDYRGRKPSIPQADLRKLVERWKYAVDNPGSVRVNSITDCANELDKLLKLEVSDGRHVR